MDLLVVNILLGYWKFFRELGKGGNFGFQVNAIETATDEFPTESSEFLYPSWPLLHIEVPPYCHVLILC